MRLRAWDYGGHAVSTMRAVCRDQRNASEVRRPLKGRIGRRHILVGELHGADLRPCADDIESAPPPYRRTCRFSYDIEADAYPGAGVRMPSTMTVHFSDSQGS